MEEALELRNRRKIFEIVSRFPGAYLREIQKEAGLETGVLEYHLEYLVKKGILSSEIDGRYRRYFVSEEVHYLDRKILGLLRQRIPRGIVMHLLLNPSCRFQELLKKFHISKSTLSFHLKKLTRAGILDEETVGREKCYNVSDAEKVSRILITYKSSFLDDAVDRFAEVWMELRV